MGSEMCIRDRTCTYRTIQIRPRSAATCSCHVLVQPSYCTYCTIHLVAKRHRPVGGRRTYCTTHLLVALTPPPSRWSSNLSYCIADRLTHHHPVSDRRTYRMCSRLASQDGFNLLLTVGVSCWQAHTVRQYLVVLVACGASYLQPLLLC